MPSEKRYWDCFSVFEIQTVLSHFWYVKWKYFLERPTWTEQAHSTFNKATKTKQCEWQCQNLCVFNQSTTWSWLPAVHTFDFTYLLPIMIPTLSYGSHIQQHISFLLFHFRLRLHHFRLILRTLFLKGFPNILESGAVRSKHCPSNFFFSRKYAHNISNSVSLLSLCALDVVVWLSSKAFRVVTLGLILTHWLSAYTLWSYHTTTACWCGSLCSYVCVHSMFSFVHKYSTFHNKLSLLNRMLLYMKNSHFHSVNGGEP